MPAGLSMTSQPWIGMPRGLRVIALVAVVRRPLQIALDPRIVEQLVDAAGLVESTVDLEADRRREAQADRVGKLGSEEAGGPVEGSDQVRPLAAAERHDESRGVAQIGADADFGDRHLDAVQRRIAEMLVGEDPHQGVAQLLADAKLSLTGGIAPPSGHGGYSSNRPSILPPPLVGGGLRGRGLAPAGAARLRC